MKTPALSHLRSPRLVRLALIGLVFAIGLAIGSLGIQRSGPQRAVVAQVCGAAGDEPCYESLRNGGFPFGFLFDRPTVAVPYRLGPEDEIRPLPLLGDIACFWALLGVAWSFGRFRRRNMGEMMPRRPRRP